MAPSGASTGVSLWKDRQDIYPPPDDIAKCMQDKGVQKSVKRQGKNVIETQYTQIVKLARLVYKNIFDKIKPDCLTKNPHRTSKQLANTITWERKHKDVNETNIFFHQYGDNGKVYLITDDPAHSGLDVAIALFQEHAQQKQRQKNAARTCNDALRLACIMLDDRHRGSVARILSGTKSRTQSDQSNDTTLAWYEKILQDDFLNPDYDATAPSHFDDFPVDERCAWDPNASSIFEHERTAEWLKGTWNEYLRPKYRSALGRWKQETGGGDGTPPSFIDYCQTDRWLVYVYCKDCETNFLLENNAGMDMPAHLQMESGFSSETTDPSPRAKRGPDPSVELEEFKRQRGLATETLERAVAMMERREATQPQPPTNEELLTKVHDLSRKLADPEGLLQSMSPDIKEDYTSHLKTERRNVMAKLNLME